MSDAAQHHLQPHQLPHERRPVAVPRRHVGPRARQRAGNTGLAYTARYTLSRAKDNLSNTFSCGSNNGIANGLGFLDPLNPDLDWGYAEFDVRHRVVASAIWEIPLARNSSGAAKALLNGWQLSALFTARSGRPFSIGDCSNGVDFYCARMALVAPVSGYMQRPTPDAVEYVRLPRHQQPGGGYRHDRQPADRRQRVCGVT